jgi:hypothetical protein
MKININVENSFVLEFGDVLLTEKGSILMVVNNASHECKIGILNLQTYKIENNYININYLESDVRNNCSVSSQSGRVKQMIKSNELMLSLNKDGDADINTNGN